MSFFVMNLTDTIARAIGWGVADLANNPRVLKKLQMELDYLQAVIKEILRLRMAAPLLVPYMNINHARLGGFDIPAESRITFNAWWLANNPAHWKAPEEFRPERFLEEESHVEITGNDFRYVPFGVGRRSCPGVAMALPILGITLGRLVHNFDFLLPPGQTKIDTRENSGQFSLNLLNPCTIVLRPR